MSIQDLSYTNAVEFQLVDGRISVLNGTKRTKSAVSKQQNLKYLRGSCVCLGGVTSRSVTLQGRLRLTVFLASHRSLLCFPLHTKHGVIVSSVDDV